MKTILYQPIFINPQAYFVFPQLYHIEKGDSYIEPANITGQLIINNLSEGLTLTPTVNVIQDSNKITGVSNLSYKLALQYGYITKDSKYIQKEIFISKDGIYSYDINNVEIPDENNIAQTIYNRFYFDKEVINDVNLIVEEIPDYPNQLCYDGKSYAITYGLPILTDYTVIADRTWFAEKVDNGVFMSKALEQNGAFILEYKQGDRWNTYSYYSATNINIDKDNSIVYQTKNKYNEQTIYPGDKQDTDTLFIGTIRKDDSRSFIGCHGDILLFNRTLTEYEISWVKNNMMCSKQQEPDIDL